jgi:dipeptidyl aminopeptidase/acylaminoacyl peptidase
MRVAEESLPHLHWAGEEYLKGPVRAVLLELHGAHYTDTRVRHTAFTRHCAEHGILVLFPFLHPFSFMNPLDRALLDQLLDWAPGRYGFDPGLPMILHGNSMGGQGVLTYARLGKHPCRAVIAKQPVTDLFRMWREKPDNLTRMLVSSHRGHGVPLEESIQAHSPYQHVEALPCVPYLFLHGPEDPVVSGLHTEAMVEKMRSLGYAVRFLNVPGYGHSGYEPLTIIQAEADFVLEVLG